LNLGAEKRKPAVLDCNVWLCLLSAKDARLQDKVVEQGYPVIITSYGVVEVLRALKRLSKDIAGGYATLEEDFWELCNSATIRREFASVISESLIGEVGRKPEFRLIAKLLGLETKDVPYVVSAFQFDAIFVTTDARSILDKRGTIKQFLGLEIIGLEEFLKEP
jgi:predicted nucleic acid-binding protein